jgi:HEAT repeat protein
MLTGPDPALAVTAATSLGSVGNNKAVEPLVRALASPDPRVRLAIIGALGTIRTQNARQALDLAAEGHPDPATRRAALGEVVRLARRHGTTLAPMSASPGAGTTAARIAVAPGGDAAP